MEGDYHFTQIRDTAEQDLMVSSNTRLCLDKKKQTSVMWVTWLGRPCFLLGLHPLLRSPQTFEPHYVDFTSAPQTHQAQACLSAFACAHPFAQTIISLLSLPNLHVFIVLVSAPESLSQGSLPIGQIPLRSVVFLVLTCPVCSFLFGDDWITT